VLFVLDKLIKNNIPLLKSNMSKLTSVKEENLLNK
jgi:hypothetical protein